jgi:DNA-binding CsgD family transcriptional regulator
MGPFGAPGLLERGSEIERLTDVVRSAAEGNGRLLVIEAPAGLGKTSLLGSAWALLDDARLTRCRARGSELELDFPFGVVRQLLEPLLFGAPLEQQARWLAGAAGLCRELFEPDAGASATSDAGAGAGFARLHGLYWLCANIAQEQPLLLVVDDAQWADEASLEFLGYLGRRLADVPVALLVATRPVDQQRAVPIARLTTDPMAVTLRPRPLTGSAVADYIERSLGTTPAPEFAEACLSATGGNPFLLSELLREVADEGLAPTAASSARVLKLGPEGVAAVIMLRLAHLPPACAAIATALAVLGEPFDTAAAVHLAGVNRDDVPSALDRLVAAEILAPDAARFAHPIVRTVIYEDMPTHERERRHSAAARYLHELGAKPEQVATQLNHAQDASEPWAQEALLVAARGALGLGTSAPAVEYLRLALRAPMNPPQRRTILLELGQAESLTGASEAAEHLTEALELSDGDAQRTESTIALARALRYAGFSQRAGDLLRAAPERIDDPALARQIEIEMLAYAQLSTGFRVAINDRLLALSEPPPGPIGPLERAQLAALGTLATASARPVDEVRRLLHRAIDGIPEQWDLVGEGLSSGVAMFMLVYTDELDLTGEAFARGLAHVRSIGSGLGIVLGSSSLATVAHRKGDLALAEGYAQSVLDLEGEIHGAEAFVGFPLATASLAAIDRGATPGELSALIERCRGYRYEDAVPYCHVLDALGRLLVATGELQGGLEMFMAAGADRARWSATNPAMVAWRSDAALALQLLGDQVRARQLAEEELELARKFGAPRALTIALRATAIVGEPEQAIELLEEAVSVSADSPARLEHAKALVELGAMLRRDGRRNDARTPLARGHALARRCGAVPLADRALAELRAAGARPRREALSGVDSLTPAERRVADVACQGKSNREVAQTLFLSEKTVEAHLGHVYTKLEIASRRDLAAALSPA